MNTLLKTSELDDAVQADARMSLAVFIELRLRMARMQLRDRLHEECRDQWEPLFARALLERMTFATSRILALEMHVARLRGLLPGATSEQRYAGFADLLAEPNFSAQLWAEYPQLERLVRTIGDHWVVSTQEFLDRFHSDRFELEQRFGLATIAVDSVQTGLGDPHHGGRSVIAIRFADGTRLVYKPRSLAVERHVQDLFQWLNHHGATPAFPLLRMIDRGHYGWLEWIDQADCESQDAVARFYHRQGANLAVVHVLKGNDLHQENVIANGEYPVLIDLETLFNPPLYPLVTATDAVTQASNDLADSVIAVGLLPTALVAAGRDALLVDGLGSSEEAWTPTEVPVWHGLGTDSMELRREKVRLPESRNRVTHDGRAMDAGLFVEDFLDGFRSTYRLIQHHRDALLAENGPIHSFANDEIRIVLRPTQTYGNLAMDGLHPDMLRSASSLESLNSRLDRDLVQRPNLSRVVAFEKAALVRGDIPRFTSTPASKHLIADDGTIIPNFFDRSGLDLVVDRINRLSENDLARQEWYIRASLERPAKTPFVSVSNPPTDPEHLATQIGDRLFQLAIRGDRTVTWNTIVEHGSQRAAVSPVSLDLFDGLPGITLFLATLGKVTGQSRFTETAHDAVAMQNRLLENPLLKVESLGGMTGIGGLIYSFTKLGQMWNDRSLVERAIQLSDRIPNLIDRDRTFDLISGTAGCLACLHSLRRELPAARFQHVAALCVSHLARHAQPQGKGKGHSVPEIAERPLLGFSHGAAGIAWALQRTADIVPEAGDLGESILAYERSCFDGERNNWPDFRRSNHDSHGTTSFWCHGAAGIGLARASRQNQDEPSHAEMQIAMETTLQHGFGHSHCLCHGDMGNLLILCELDAAMGHLNRDRVQQKCDSLLSHLSSHAMVCGSSKNLESPGLMTGLAGIGIGLLQLAEFPFIPHVLTFE